MLEKVDFDNLTRLNPRVLTWIFFCVSNNHKIRHREKAQVHCQKSFHFIQQYASESNRLLVGVGGDVIILEEAAYVSSGFFYETVAPLLCIGNTSFIAISTLTSEMNFYTKLISKVDPLTLEPVFKAIQIQLACQACQDAEKSFDCMHMQHLIPRWQDQVFHVYFSLWNFTLDFFG